MADLTATDIQRLPGYLRASASINREREHNATAGHLATAADAIDLLTELLAPFALYASVYDPSASRPRPTTAVLIRGNQSLTVGDFIAARDALIVAPRDTDEPTIGPTEQEKAVLAAAQEWTRCYDHDGLRDGEAGMLSRLNLARAVTDLKRKD